MTTTTEDLDTPTWAEVYAAWDPDTDGQGNEGLAAALDRITAERVAARARLAELVADMVTAQENYHELAAEQQNEIAHGGPWHPLEGAIAEAAEARDLAEAKVAALLEAFPHLPIPAELPV